MKTPGKIRKRIILGQKFDYGEKAKEKQNYVYFVAGQGQEKTEIEEMEQIRGKPKKEERIVEEKEIIDNYQYHETKDIRKKHQKDSQTHHQRLCSPFERTKIRKYASYTTEPIQSGYKIIKKTDLVNKNGTKTTKRNIFKRRKKKKRKRKNITRKKEEKAEFNE